MVRRPVYLARLPNKPALAPKHFGAKEEIRSKWRLVLFGNSRLIGEKYLVNVDQRFSGKLSEHVWKTIQTCLANYLNGDCWNSVLSPLNNQRTVPLSVHCQDKWCNKREHNTYHSIPRHKWLKFRLLSPEIVARESNAFKRAMLWCVVSKRTHELCFYLQQRCVVVLFEFKYVNICTRCARVRQVHVSLWLHSWLWSISETFRRIKRCLVYGGWERN